MGISETDVCMQAIGVKMQAISVSRRVAYLILYTSSLHC